MCSYSFKELSASQNLEIFRLFTQAYSRYTDARSRDAVEAIVVEMVKQGQQSKDKASVMDEILAWLANETNRISKQSPSGWVVQFIFLWWVPMRYYSKVVRFNRHFHSLYVVLWILRRMFKVRPQFLWNSFLVCSGWHYGGPVWCTVARFCAYKAVTTKKHGGKSTSCPPLCTYCWSLIFRW
jgi:hypothetical protein